ncbi:MAG: putative nucleic acid-binding Zn-ribbon protein [Gammaproteobacteria bacterium]
MSIQIDISVGELIDKITILQIKSERISDDAKLKNINKELGVLQTQWSSSSYKNNDLDKNTNDLKKVNEKLWEIEDKIRIKESQQCFDNEFIELARSVYFINDERAELKRKLNSQTGSALVEEKSYSNYSADKP